MFQQLDSFVFLLRLREAGPLMFMQCLDMFMFDSLQAVGQVRF